METRNVRKDRFLEIKEVVLTHAVFQKRIKSLNFHDKDIDNKMAIALILSNGKLSFTNEESAGLELNSLELTQFLRHVRNITNPKRTVEK